MGIRQEKKLRTRSEIEAAAFELFEEVGYESSRTAEIARRAEVSESTLFRYFATKEEIALAPFRRRCQYLIERVLERPLSESPMEVAEALAERDDVVDLVPSKGRRTEWMVLTEAPSLMPMVLSIIYDTELTVASNFEDRLGPGSTLQAMIAASAVGGALQAMLFLWAVEPDDFDPWAATRAGIAQLRKGLG